jgi:hypothetical protein
MDAARLGCLRVERSPSLLFHAGHDDKRNISACWTDRIMSGYSAPLRQYLIAGHYMETPAFHTRASRGGCRHCPQCLMHNVAGTTRILQPAKNRLP